MSDDTFIKVNGSAPGYMVRRCTKAQHAAAGGDNDACNRCQDNQSCEIGFFSYAMYQGNARAMALDFAEKNASRPLHATA